MSPQDQNIASIYAQGQAESEEQRWQRLLQGGQPPTPTPAATPPKPSGPSVGGAVAGAAKQVVGAAETGAAFAGAALEFLNPLPGLAGIVKTLTSGPEAGTRTIREIQAALHPYLVYQPQTEAGKAGIGVIHKAFELLGKAAETVGSAVQTGVSDVAGEKSGEIAGTTAQSLVELAPILVFEGVRGAKAKIAAGKRLTAAERTSVEQNIAEVGKELEGTVEAAKEAARAETTPPGSPPPAPPAGAPPPEPPLITIQAVPFEQGKAFRKENPGSFTIGSKGVTVNWGAVDNPLAIGEIVNKTTLLHREGLAEAKRGVMSDTLVKDLADRLGLTTDDLLSRHPGEEISVEKTMAYMDLLNSSSDSVARLAKEVTEGKLGADDAMLRAFTAHLGVDSQARGVGSEAGRTLRIMQKASDESVHLRSVIGEIGEIVTPKEGGDVPLAVTPQRLAEMIVAKGAREAPGFLKKFSILDSAVEAYYGFILGPKTISRNITGNTAAAVIGVPVRYVAGTRPIRFLGGIKYEGVEHVVPGEAAAMLGRGGGGDLIAFSEMLKDSLRAAWQTLKTGQRVRSGSIFETRAGTGVIRAETYGFTGALGRFVDWTGAVIRAVPRSIMGVDEFYGGLAYNMQRNAIAVRQATIEGHTGEAFSNRVARLIEDMPEPLEKQAQVFGRTQTFSKDLEGRVKSLQHAASHPVARLTVAPFFRTPVRLGEYAIEMVPGANMLLKPYREDILAGGARREMALAKATVGAGILSTFATLAYMGYATGNGPRNRSAQQNLRLTGWRPVSLYDPVNNEYVSLLGMEPLSSHMAMAANMVAIAERLPAGNYFDMFLLGSLAIGEASVQKSYLQSISMILDVYNSEDPNKAVQIMRRQLASYVVPTVVRDIERMNDPPMREVNSLMDEIISRIPLISGTLPYHRDFFGEPVVTEGAWGPDIMSPFFISTRKDDPVSDEMARLAHIGAQYPAPPKVIHGAAEQEVVTGPKKTLPGVELTPEEYDRYVVLARKEGIGPGGRSLHEELGRLFQSAPYQKASDGPRGGKVLLRDATVSRYDQAGLLKLRKEFPELNEAIRQRERTRIRERLPLRLGG